MDQKRREIPIGIPVGMVPTRRRSATDAAAKPRRLSFEELHTMKKLATLMLVLAMSVFTIGCNGAADTDDAAPNGDATDNAADDAADATDDAADDAADATDDATDGPA